MDNLPELPQNAVSSVTIHGLAIDTQQSPVPLSLSSGNRIPGTVWDHENPKYNRPGGVPPRPPSTLPPPLNLHLSLTLDSKISYGATGAVYTCTIDDACSAAMSQANSGLKYYIPPLVVKIATPRTAKDIATEAWFYDEMESLQCSIIPRCYGFFVVEVLESLDIPTWKELGYWGREPWEEGPDPPRILSILVLEKLGEPLPFGRPFPPGAREEISEMLHELGEHGTLHQDIRRLNVLSVLPSPPALPSRPSPSSNRVYGWRIIDFDRSNRTSAGTEYIQFITRLGMDVFFE